MRLVGGFNRLVRLVEVKFPTKSYYANLCNTVTVERQGNAFNLDLLCAISNLFRTESTHAYVQSEQQLLTSDMTDKITPKHFYLDEKIIFNR